MGASNAGAVGKNRNSQLISGFRISDWWSMVDRAVFIAVSVDVRLPHRPPRISESCLSQPARMTMPKRTEQNLIVRSGKSEAKLPMIKECARGIVVLKLTTD